MTENTRLVSIVGFRRSGTTWLYRFFREHDGVFVPFIKEMNYFAQRAGTLHPYQLDRIQQHFHDIKATLEARGLGLTPHALERRDRAEMRSDADYLRFYQSRAGDLPFFDISPSYCEIGREGLCAMADLCPEARVVLLIRDRADHLWSEVNLLQRRLHPDLTADEIFRQLRARIEAGDPTAPPPAQYRRTHEDLTAVFSASRVLTLFTEDLFDPARQQGVLSRLCDFIGVPRRPLGAFEYSANRGRYDPMPEEVRDFAVRHGQADYLWALETFGRLPQRWHDNHAAAVGTPVEGDQALSEGK